MYKWKYLVYIPRSSFHERNNIFILHSFMDAAKLQGFTNLVSLILWICLFISMYIWPILIIIFSFLFFALFISNFYVFLCVFLLLVYRSSLYIQILTFNIYAYSFVYTHMSLYVIYIIYTDRLNVFSWFCFVCIVLHNFLIKFLRVFKTGSKIFNFLYLS